MHRRPGDGSVRLGSAEAVPPGRRTSPSWQAAKTPYVRRNRPLLPWLLDLCPLLWLSDLARAAAYSGAGYQSCVRQRQRRWS